MIIEVRRDALAEVRETSTPAVPLGAGRARLRVDRFGLTTNNVTYAVFGDAMRYWDFFPVDAGWGCIPVWGFAEIVETTADGCVAGERVYGYLPTASELVVEPGSADARGFADVAAHRAPMASAYNRYTRCATDPGYDATREAQQMLLYPLFFTSFVVDDFFSDHDDFGADVAVLSSASSKTAIGIAFLAHRRGRRVCGLTSARNEAFVASLGVYDDVVRYDDVADPGGSAVYVDMAGNVDVRRAVHEAYGDRLGHSMVVGGTHWDHTAAPTDAALPGPAPEFFFAPTQIAKRSTDWGREELDRRTAEAWTAYSRWTDAWLEPREATGADAVVAAYRELLAGDADPRVGYVCSLPDRFGG